jgi:hypothetical protein
VVDQSLIETIIKAGAMADFFLHGVRDLTETKMAELKVPRHIRDRLFDRADDHGSSATYEHHEYESEMRSALEKWAAHVETLVAPSGARVLR